LSLRGKCALVTGAASGIGWHVARAFAEAGANVATTFNTSQEKAAECMVTLKKEYGVEAMVVEMDVRDAERVEEGVKEVVEQFGRLDIVSPLGITMALPI
jgi:NAD(P)-dependent dehydrogenase (short-subunit alcohol dehydrogenase family)